MATYNVLFVADWGWIGTTVIASDEEIAMDKALKQLMYEAEIPWPVLATMPHAEVEIAEDDVSLPDHTLYNDAYHPTPE